MAKYEKLKQGVRRAFGKAWIEAGCPEQLLFEGWYYNISIRKSESKETRDSLREIDWDEKGLPDVHEFRGEIHHVIPGLPELMRKAKEKSGK